MARIGFRPAVVPPEQRFRSGLYYGPYGSTTTAVVANDQLRVTPFYVPRPTRFTAIGIDLTALGEAGSLARLGIWGDLADGIGGHPGALLLSPGTVPGDGVLGHKEIVIDFLAPAGLIWLGVAVQNAPTTQPAMRVLSGKTNWIGAAGGAALVNALFIGGVSGALPDPFTATTATTNGPRMVVKAA